MRVFEQVPGYQVRLAFFKSPQGRWILWHDEKGLVGQFKTKREANRAIPMRETTRKYSK